MRTQGLGDEADFGLDEIAAEVAAVHVERMDRNAFYMSIAADGRELVLWFRVDKRTLRVTHEWRDARPSPEPTEMSLCSEHQTPVDGCDLCHVEILPDKS